jgi:hypothetical protein
MIKQDVQDEVKQYKDTSIKELEKDTETPKWTQQGLQQTPKLNKGDCKRKDIWNKEDSTRYERGIEQSMKNLRKKESNRNLRNKKSL